MGWIPASMVAGRGVPADHHRAASSETIDIVFDEGTDTGPDYFGIAILDNIMVNGVSVGRRVS